ncbi:MAG: hypothetical protein WCL14_11545 [Bacteroidota bacterium]
MLAKSPFGATYRQNLAPIVAAARCFVSEMGRQRLQRIAGRNSVASGEHGLQKENLIGFI